MSLLPEEQASPEEGVKIFRTKDIRIFGNPI